MSTNSADPTGRPYRSALRAEQASRSRRRIVEAAAQVFSERGYRGTHLRNIATEAGVSVQLVNLNGPKAALLLAALEHLSLGSETPSSTTEASELRETVGRFTSPDELLGWLARFATTSNRKVTGIWQALEHAAAEEPEVTTAFTRLVARQRRDARLGVELLLRLAGRPVEDDLGPRADLLWAITLPDLYRRLVQQAGWTEESYTSHVERALRSALLGDDRSEA